MELGYPGTNSENEFGLQEYDGSTSDANLDLNHEVNKGGEVNGPENEVWDDRTQMEVDELAHHRSSLLHADVEHEGPKSPYEQTNSREDSRFRHDEKIQEFDFDNERTYSYIGETEMGSGRYFDKLDSPVEGGLHNELEVGNLAKADVDSGADYMEQQNNMKERSAHHEEDAYSGKELDNVQNGRNEYLHKPEIESTENLGSVFYDDKRTEEGDINNSRKSPSDNEKLEGTWNDIHPTGTTRQRSSSPLREMSSSPVRGNETQRDADGKLPLSPQGRDFSYSSPRMSTEKFSPFERHHHRESSSSPLREMSRSPVRANEIRGASQKLPLSPRGQDFSYSPRRMPGQNFSPSPERHGGNSKRDLSQDHPSLSARRISASPGGRSRRDSPHRDSSVMKSTSPRRRHLSPGRRRNERSVSRSPTRRRDLSSGYRRDYRDRSRSRSPSAAGRYRRSPRRYSPRRRSPPSGYHSRRRSPRRKPWSPPRNRNNGIGRPGNNLFVAGFSFVTTERDLERKFSRFGRVRDVRIVRDKRSGDSRGFGFLSLERDEDADEAIRALDQTEWNGRVVLVEKSKTR